MYFLAQMELRGKRPSSLEGRPKIENGVGPPLDPNLSLTFWLTKMVLTLCYQFHFQWQRIYSITIYKIASCVNFLHQLEIYLLSQIFTELYCRHLMKCVMIHKSIYSDIYVIFKDLMRLWNLCYFPYFFYGSFYNGSELLLEHWKFLFISNILL